ncbi:MAG TPA: LysE family translocator [Woeseiaceae bacterium]|nr:LysE family translocator [Woeseiaceae bacterium]
MDNIAALIIATFVLVLIPGPNVALIVANTLQHGLRAGMVTVFGTTVGIALQLALVTAGLTAVIHAAASALLWIKWLGVIYLLYLAVITWRQHANDLTGVRPDASLKIFRHGLLLAVVNPKVLLFNAAFLPQFVAGSGNATAEVVLVAAVYLAILVCGDMLWAVFASSARRGLSRFGHLRNRMTAVFLFCAGLGLALSRRNS